MKAYSIKLICLLVIGSLSACHNQLDLATDGRIVLDEVFSDYNRLRGYLNSCYGYAPPPYMDRSSFTDESQDADDVTPGSNYSIWYGGNITSSSFPSFSVDGSPWSRLFEGVRKCNVFLENIHTATAHVSEDEKSGWVAQAHTLRALYYLQLIKRYGGVPIFDKSLAIGHDFGGDQRASFSEVVQFILNDCDAALAAPATKDGFPWEVYDNQFGIMTRAVAYAIKSQAVTYAASPLWADGTFTWADATRITAEALAACLANDYSLFNVQPNADIAQNPYALYFITSSNDQRAVDKETIYQLGAQMEVWRWGGLPTNPGMNRSGPGPTQGLIDAYEMANGEPAILGYEDADHLKPIINPASGYDESNPYVGRDPRFYASIYYNGAPRNLVASDGSVVEHELDFIAEAVNHLEVEVGDHYDFTTTGTDPNVQTTGLSAPLRRYPAINLSFEYQSDSEINELQVFFGPGLAESRTLKPGSIPASTEWQTYTVNISTAVIDFNWGGEGDFFRLDLGTEPGKKIRMRNLKITEDGAVAGKTVDTYVGGAEGISATDRRHTRTGYYMRKFNNHLSGLNNNADGAIRLFRLAELYLNFAESAYQSAGPDVVVNESGLAMSARAAINAVRARAEMPALPVGLSNEEFEKRYRNERRIELAFEEHRYFDVRRWKILQQTDAFVTGMRIIQNGDDTFTYTRFKFRDRDCSSDKYLHYPIDQNEVNKIFELTGQNWQNPGW